MGRCRQVLHAGDLICEGTIKMNAEVASKPADADAAETPAEGGEPVQAGEAVAPEEAGGSSLAPLSDTEKQPPVCSMFTVSLYEESQIFDAPNLDPGRVAWSPCLSHQRVCPLSTAILQH